MSEIKYYDYKNKDGDTFKILPALADIQNTLKTYKIPNNNSIYTVDYPCLIGDTLKKVDMGLYNSAVKCSMYGTVMMGSTIFFEDKSPQEKRNNARTSFQKKLDKVKNA